MDENKKFLEWVKKQNLDLSMKPESFGYDNPNIILIDAVLSINRQYASFVKPRVELMKNELKEINTLSGLKDLISKKGYKSFLSIWKYNHKERLDLLNDLLDFFISYRKKEGVKSDREAMVLWASKNNPLPIKGVGLKTKQYLRMMLGISTVKPDTHLHRVVESVLAKKCSDEQIISIIEETAKELNVPATSLDHGLWKMSAKYKV